MAKPILVVRLPFLTSDERAENIRQRISKDLFDYHLIFLKEPGIDQAKFEVLNPDNVQKLEEFKKKSIY